MIIKHVKILENKGFLRKNPRNPWYPPILNYWSFSSQESVMSSVWLIIAGMRIIKFTTSRISSDSTGELPTPRQVRLVCCSGCFQRDCGSYLYQRKVKKTAFFLESNMIGAGKYWQWSCFLVKSLNICRIFPFYSWSMFSSYTERDMMKWLSSWEQFLPELNKQFNIKLNVQNKDMSREEITWCGQGFWTRNQVWSVHDWEYGESSRGWKFNHRSKVPV